MTNPRPIADLIATDDPAWPRLRELLAAATVPVEVLPVDPAAGLDVLYRLQVTARSMLGGFALNTGAVRIDHGWLTLLGGGIGGIGTGVTTDANGAVTGGLPDLASASGLGDPAAETAGPPPALIVAIDALGGRFAVNGGGLDAPPGEICYFGPDTLRWDALGAGHTAFVEWVLQGGTTEFYEGIRWPGWEAEAAALRPDQGISTFPPPWTEEGKDLGAVSRKAVPLLELVGFIEDTARQFDGA